MYDSQKKKKENEKIGFNLSLASTGDQKVQLVVNYNAGGSAAPSYVITIPRQTWTTVSCFFFVVILQFNIPASLLGISSLTTISGVQFVAWSNAGETPQTLVGFRNINFFNTGKRHN